MESDFDESYDSDDGAAPAPLRIVPSVAPAMSQQHKARLLLALTLSPVAPDATTL